jgi:hypothetical protein
LDLPEKKCARAIDFLLLKNNLKFSKPLSILQMKTKTERIWTVIMLGNVKASAVQKLIAEKDFIIIDPNFFEIYSEKNMDTLKTLLNNLFTEEILQIPISLDPIRLSKGIKLFEPCVIKIIDKKISQYLEEKWTETVSLTYGPDDDRAVFFNLEAKNKDKNEDKKETPQRFPNNPQPTSLSEIKKMFSQHHTKTVTFLKPVPTLKVDNSEYSIAKENYEKELKEWLNETLTVTAASQKATLKEMCSQYQKYIKKHTAIIYKPTTTHSELKLENENIKKLAEIFEKRHKKLSKAHEQMEEASRAAQKLKFTPKENTVDKKKDNSEDFVKATQEFDAAFQELIEKETLIEKFEKEITLLGADTKITPKNKQFPQVVAEIKQYSASSENIRKVNDHTKSLKEKIVILDGQINKLESRLENSKKRAKEEKRQEIQPVVNKKTKKNKKSTTRKNENVPRVPREKEKKSDKSPGPVALPAAPALSTVSSTSFIVSITSNGFVNQTINPVIPESKKVVQFIVPVAKRKERHHGLSKAARQARKACNIYYANIEKIKECKDLKSHEETVIDFFLKVIFFQLTLALPLGRPSGKKYFRNSAFYYLDDVMARNKMNHQDLITALDEYMTYVDPHTFDYSDKRGKPPISPLLKELSHERDKLSYEQKDLREVVEPEHQDQLIALSELETSDVFNQAKKAGLLTGHAVGLMKATLNELRTTHAKKSGDYSTSNPGLFNISQKKNTSNKEFHHPSRNNN